MYYVYIYCPHFEGYRWVCRFKHLHTALESCNRKREREMKADLPLSFVSDRSDRGLSKDLGLDWDKKERDDLADLNRDFMRLMNNEQS